MEKLTGDQILELIEEKEISWDDLGEENVDWDELSFDFIEIYVYNDNTCRIRFIEDAF